MVPALAVIVALDLDGASGVGDDGGDRLGDDWCGDCGASCLGTGEVPELEAQGASVDAAIELAGKSIVDMGLDIIVGADGDVNGLGGCW